MDLIFSKKQLLYLKKNFSLIKAPKKNKLTFYKKNCIIGACGIGKKGKIGKDIKLSTKILEKKILFQDEDLANKDFKLNKILK